MVRQLFWKIFPPYESTTVKRLLNDFLNEEAELARDEIGRLLFPHLKRNPQVLVDAIRINHIPPDRVALGMLEKVLFFALISGQYHTYRGLLGMVGKDMQRVWQKAVNIMVENEYLEEEEANQLRKDLHEEIKHVG